MTEATKQYTRRTTSHCLTDTDPRPLRMEAGSLGPTQTDSRTRGRKIAVTTPSLALHRYRSTPIATARARYRMDEAATAGPKAWPAVTALKVWAVMSVKATIT